MIIKISQNQIFIVLSRVTVVTVLNTFLLQRYCLIKLKKKLLKNHFLSDVHVLLSHSKNILWFQ